MTGSDMITRRGTVVGALGLVIGARHAFGSGLRSGFAEELARLEAASGGRLGVAVLDIASGDTGGYRDDERFPLCSTFKLLATAAVLARVDAGRERLDRRMVFTAEDVVVNSPVAATRVGGSGMALDEICAAAMEFSDNTAGNLLLRALGGPTDVTAYARSLGDPATRLDRVEPELNEALPDDPRDTTTPSAMLGNLRRLVLEEVLTPASRALLIGWLVGNRTGDTRLRAGVPAGWRVGDKTGAGERGSTNDIGVLWPSGRAPVIVTAYFTGSTIGTAERNAVLASVSRLVVAAVSPPHP